GEPRGQLVRVPRDHHGGHDHVEGDSRTRSGEQSEVGVARDDGGGEAAGGADEHDAFDSEVHDSGALADDLAEGGVEDRGHQRQRDRGDAGNRGRAHAAFLCMRPRSTIIIRIAERTLTIADGNPCVICRMSPLEASTASRNVIGTISRGLCPASQLIRKPRYPKPGERPVFRWSCKAEAWAIPARPARPPPAAMARTM